MQETIGKRIAYLRQQNGWTQQSLANRLAMSRVAISHIEMDLTIPGERSITLMAGIFKLSPLELVTGTTYPLAKAERLPEMANLYTELELQFAFLSNDCQWISQQKDPAIKRMWIRQLLEKWSPRLEGWQDEFSDEHENLILQKMVQAIEKLTLTSDHARA